MRLELWFMFHFVSFIILFGLVGWQIGALAEFGFSGHMTDELRNFLELCLPKVKDGKKPKFSFGVAEPKLGSHVIEITKIPCQSGEFVTDELRNFLELSLPKVKDGKKPKFSLGVAEPKLGSHVNEITKIPCQSGEFVLVLLHGVRLHFDRFIENLKRKILRLLERNFVNRLRSGLNFVTMGLHLAKTLM